MALLKRSIIEDGWTHPIVVFAAVDGSLEIVDGFHRWTLSADPNILARDNGYVPTVELSGKKRSDRQVSTIRHNRARGTHGVLPMAEIVAQLVSEGIDPAEICTRLGMDREELARLANTKGLPVLVGEQHDFAPAWVPTREKNPNKAS